MGNNIAIIEDLGDLNSKYIDQFNKLQIAKHLEEEPGDTEEDAPILSPEDKDVSQTTFQISLALDEDSDIIIGFSLLLYQNPEVDVPVFPPGMGFGQGFVRPEDRQSGVGTKLYQNMIQQARDLAITNLLFNSSSKVGTQFLLARDGTIQSKHSQQRLYLDNLDDSLLEKWAEIPLPEDYSLQFVDQISDEDMEEYCELYSYLTNNQTRENNQKENQITKTAEMRRKEEVMAKENNHDLVTLFLRNSQQSIIGLTEVYYQPQEPNRIRQNLTGIIPDERGQGFGKLIKAKAYQKVIADHPEVDFIFTTNDITNAAMQSINRKLGFEHYKTVNAIRIVLA